MADFVDILLATYQGANYIEEQLESILTQSYPFIHLWIRDDGSMDETWQICKKWFEIYPDHITLLPSATHGGIIDNFSELMHCGQAPYVMFADQDDKWLPNKVEVSLDCLKKLERQYGSHVPLLIHTDLKVVDRKLNEIASSFWEYTGLNPQSVQLSRLLTQNNLVGCTMCMNRRLIHLAYPLPKQAIMHDWWIALVASTFGHIQWIDQATLLYRQHESNDVGAKPYRLWNFFKQEQEKRQKKHLCFLKTFEQARAFLNRYSADLPIHQKTLIEAYIQLIDLPFFQKISQIFKHQFFKQGFWRNTKHILQIQ